MLRFRISPSIPSNISKTVNGRIRKFESSERFGTSRAERNFRLAIHVNTDILHNPLADLSAQTARSRKLRAH